MGRLTSRGWLLLAAAGALLLYALKTPTPGLRDDPALAQLRVVASRATVAAAGARTEAAVARGRQAGAQAAAGAAERRAATADSLRRATEAQLTGGAIVRPNGDTIITDPAVLLLLARTDTARRESDVARAAEAHRADVAEHTVRADSVALAADSVAIATATQRADRAEALLPGPCRVMAWPPCVSAPVAYVAGALTVLALLLRR